VTVYGFYVSKAFANPKKEIKTKKKRKPQNILFIHYHNAGPTERISVGRNTHTYMVEGSKSFSTPRERDSMRCQDSQILYLKNSAQCPTSFFGSIFSF
jgi:hypothetical protein